MICKVKRKSRKELTPIVSGLSLVLSVTALAVALSAGHTEPVRVSEPAPTRHFGGVGRHSVIETEAVTETETEAVTETETEAEPAPVDVEPVVLEEPTSLGTFKLTAYCGEHYPHICNDGDATNTATGATPKAGRTIAVDPKVIPLGSVVVINGHEYVAEDTGGDIKGNRIDIHFTTHAEALQFGVQYAEVAIY